MEFSSQTALLPFISLFDPLLDTIMVQLSSDTWCLSHGSEYYGAGVVAYTVGKA